MNATVTKFFRFSASHVAGTKVLGKNYRLEISLDALLPGEELAFEKKVHEKLIKKIESRDLGLHVDFLKDIEITDRNLLEAFWRVLRESVPGFEIRSMTLQRDETTKTTIVQ